MIGGQWRVYVSYPSSLKLAYLVTTHLNWSFAVLYALSQCQITGLRHHIRKNGGDTYIVVNKPYDSAAKPPSGREMDLLYRVARK